MHGAIWFDPILIRRVSVEVLGRVLDQFEGSNLELEEAELKSIDSQIAVSCTFFINFKIFQSVRISTAAGYRIVVGLALRRKRFERSFCGSSTIFIRLVIFGSATLAGRLRSHPFVRLSIRWYPLFGYQSSVQSLALSLELTEGHSLVAHTPKYQSTP